MRWLDIEKCFARVSACYLQAFMLFAATWRECISTVRGQAVCSSAGCIMKFYDNNFSRSNPIQKFIFAGLQPSNPMHALLHQDCNQLESVLLYVELSILKRQHPGLLCRLSPNSKEANCRRTLSRRVILFCRNFNFNWLHVVGGQLLISNWYYQQLTCFR